MADLRILLVEDDPLDAELVVRELQKSGYDPEWHRVDTQAEFTKRLAQDPPDIIISDHVMPQFSSTEALKCLHESRLTTPFIVVSHAIGDEEAVGLMREGAADYILKDRMARLGEAVRLGLEKQRLRLQYAEAQQDLRLLNQELERRIDERTGELEIANSQLARELSERKQIEEQLRQLTGTLEERVKERTQQLSTSYARLRALATDLTVAEQTERRRLAMELHDYLAQILVVARMKVGQLLAEDHDPEEKKTLQGVDQLLHQSLDYTRSLVSELTPQALYESGLGAAIRWLGDQMRRQAVLNVECKLDTPELRLPEADAILLFHSIRELLFNVLKHGKVNRASVSMQRAQDRLSITVSDHGCGFDVSKLSDDHSNRFGLLSIRERMAALGGSFDLRSVPGKGTVASLHLPYTSLDVGTEAPAAEREQSAALEDAVCGGHCHPSLSVDNLSDGKISTAVRILIVDDHQLMREGLHCLLDEYDDLTVVGEASTGQQALQLVGTLMPEVVIIDMQMPGWNGAETTKRILSQYPLITIIGLSVQTDPHIGEAMLEAGASVFLPKEAINTDLYAAILHSLGRSPSPQLHSSRSPA
jgi:signal transduction histidine kinase